MNSLRRRLLALWALSLVACVAVGVLLVGLSQRSATAQVQRAEAVLAHSCDLIQGRYAFYVSGWSPSDLPLDDDRLRPDLHTAVELALLRQNGVEGGIWHEEAGSLAYAFPTYQGSGPKTDLPETERPEIETVNREAARELQPVDRRSSSQTQILLLRACPLNGPISGMTGWAMTRVQEVQGLLPLQLGVGLLLALMLVMSAWLGRTLRVWGGHVRDIEHALSAPGPDGPPKVAITGESELDRIIVALNAAVQRLAEEQRRSEDMARRVAEAERLAGLGRVAAGVAHEIRNPIAAARLQGENALAGEPGQLRGGITQMLGQLARLDTLVTELLAMTQRAVPRKVPVGLHNLLEEVLANHRPAAAERRVTLAEERAEGVALLDPAMVGRILDNLLVNAIRHAPADSSVLLAAELSPGRLTLTVEDEGPGVPPEIADRLFEPFVTGRADGTGLGLAIARELADAHDGRVVLRSSGDASGRQRTVFALELFQEPDGHDPDRR